MDNPGTRIPVHSRSMSITTYLTGDDSIMVEGVLKDDRLARTFSLTTGDGIEPGTVHHFTVRLIIKGPGLVIDEVEVDMDHVPREDCLRTRESLKPLVGQAIAPGFTGWVKKNLGCARGCTHLNALVISMASAAVQGFWSARTSRREDLRGATKGMSQKFLIDTCWVWRAEGPRAAELASLLNGAPFEE
ncbi:MAG TPA: DUF2889 domain-containing protein [Deltaproteobacteria bacterium]|nr:DUF2889 domain-containing protein [Deltaproteobacteria bacterium]HOI07283.1 DUF2889 domain-containing protein [Deltaproteobacteria bacterium]